MKILAEPRLGKAVIPVEIGVGGRVLEWPGVVDTGCVYSSITGNILPLLGVTWEQLGEGFDVGGYVGAPVRHRTLECQVDFAGVTFGHRLLVSPPVTNPGIDHHWSAILGTLDFFRTFTVTTHLHKNPPSIQVYTAKGQQMRLVDPNAGLELLDPGRARSSEDAVTATLEKGAGAVENLPTYEQRVQLSGVHKKMAVRVDPDHR